ncbi:MAG: hypothetical protein Q4C13_09370 [Clostridia bacterium]|nr:hypothetical protein [Clostridia bacterium]
MSDPAEVILEALRARRRTDRPLLLAIDGRCAAGKTTLAARLAARCGAGVAHMDHFFLRPEQRDEARLSEPGGNVDRERFLTELLEPLLAGESPRYRPFDCGRQDFGPEITLGRRPLYIVEGAYACHPALRERYDLRVFLSVEPAEQRRRIRLRNGEEGLRRFQERWIPLEEAYFSHFHVAEGCELRFTT